MTQNLKKFGTNLLSNLTTQKEINDLKSKIEVLEEENKEMSRRVFRRSKTHYNAGECVYIVVSNYYLMMLFRFNFN